MTHSAAAVLRLIGVALFVGASSVALLILMAGPGWGLLVGPPSTVGLILLLGARPRRS